MQAANKGKQIKRLKTQISDVNGALCLIYSDQILVW